MNYRLKKSAAPFEAADGPRAGQRFEPGAEYTEIPAGDAAKFEKVRVPTPKKTAEKPVEKRPLQNEPQGGNK
ncbi:MAG: hypothetical protein ACNI3A_18735 [Desulfovibrio sp.]|uniref:hypothetical protein n=1 Tax=Desulfovibrio sp. 7SRBS1 TaxID=3378064 RepID=UPI003B406B4F